MSSKQWYHHLLENNVTMTPDTPRVYIQCRAETLYAENDCENTWRLARIKGLNFDQTSFI